ncbi:MAG: glycosyltransferase, partial [Anaerolineales bacterium]
MRVAFDGRAIGDHFPGIGRYAYNLARALLNAPHPPALTIFDDPRQPRTRFDLSQLSPAQFIPSASVFALSAQWRLPRQLRRASVDLYHAPYYLMPYWPGVPAVLTVHDLIPMRYPGYYTPLARLIFAVTLRLAVRASARIIAISHATAADLQRVFRLDAARIVIIPEAPDPNFVPQPASAIAAVRERLGLPAR